MSSLRVYRNIPTEWFFSSISRHPIQYHNANAGVNPWRKVLLIYVFPVLIFSLITNAPKFMETRPKYTVVGTSVYNDSELGEIVVSFLSFFKCCCILWLSGSNSIPNSWLHIKTKFASNKIQIGKFNLSIILVSGHPVVQSAYTVGTFM